MFKRGYVKLKMVLRSAFHPELEADPYKTKARSEEKEPNPAMNQHK